MRHRRGIALVMVIVVLLLIEVMSAGMLAMATHSRVVVDSRMRTARADAAALDAAQRVLADWESGGFDTIAIGRIVRVATASGGSQDAAWTASVERLSAATWLIRSDSRVGDGRAYSTGHAAAIARTLNAVSAQIDLPADSVPLGGLRWFQVESITDRLLQGSVVLADSQGTYPLTYAPGDLTVTGSGRGILVVRGDLTMKSEAAFEGLIVTDGSATLEQGAIVVGEVRSARGAVQDPGSGIFVSEDVVREVLTAAPARLRVVSEVRRFIPVFRPPERS